MAYQHAQRSFAPFGLTPSGSMPFGSRPEGMPSAVDLQMRCLSAAVAMGTEWMRFLAHRFSEEAKFARCVGTARSPQEAVSATSQFLNQAARDYSEELFRLSEAGEAAFANGSGEGQARQPRAVAAAGQQAQGKSE